MNVQLVRVVLLASGSIVLLVNSMIQVVQFKMNFLMDLSVRQQNGKHVLLVSIGNKVVMVATVVQIRFVELVRMHLYNVLLEPDVPWMINLFIQNFLPEHYYSSGKSRLGTCENGTYNPNSCCRNDTACVPCGRSKYSLSSIP